MDSNNAKCWLCGRDVERREDEKLLHSGIAIHKDCLGDGRMPDDDDPSGPALYGDMIQF